MLYLRVPKDSLVEREQLKCSACHTKPLPSDSKFCLYCGSSNLQWNRKWIKCCSEFVGPDGHLMFDFKKGYVDHPIRITKDSVFFCLPLKEMEFRLVASEIARFRDKLDMMNLFKNGERVHLFKDDCFVFDPTFTCGENCHRF